MRTIPLRAAHPARADLIGGRTASSLADLRVGRGTIRRPRSGRDATCPRSCSASWIERACALPGGDEPLPEAMAEVHAEFERTHPFLDGNGRVGRLLTNLLLIRLGYPPAIIRKGERARYLQNLRRADAGDPGPLGEFLARAIIDTLMRFVVPSVAGPARLVPIAALADHQLSARALRTAAERGRLRAQRDDRGQWRSTRLWVEDYRASRYQRPR